MQLYRGIPIITNKVTPEERQGIPHHLIDCIDVLEPPWTVSHFVRKATKIVRLITYHITAFKLSANLYR